MEPVLSDVMRGVVNVMDDAFIYRMPEVIVIHQLGQLIDAALFLYLILRFFPSRNGREIPRWGMAVILLVFTAWLALTDIWMKNNFYAYIAEMILPPLLLACLCRQGPVWLKLVVCVIFFATMSSLEIVFECLTRVLSVHWLLRRDVFVLIFLVKRVLSKPVLYLEIKMLLLDVRRRDDGRLRRYWALMAGICLAAFGVILFALENPIDLRISQSQDLVVTIFCTVVPLVCCYVMMLTIRLERADQARAAQELFSQAQAENLRAMEEVMDDTRRVRHDFQTHIFSMSALLKERDFPALSQYLRRLEESPVNHGSICAYTGCRALDITLDQKRRTAERQGIRFTVESALLGPDELGGLDPFDLTTLTANLCANALEAAAQTDDPWVRVAIRRKGVYLKITAENAAAGDVLRENPRLLTSKPDRERHGLGMGIIRDVVARCDGMLTTESEPGLFRIHILLRADTVVHDI